MTAAGVTTEYVLDNGQILEAIAQGHTTRYLYGVGLIGEQTDGWAYDLQDGTNTPRQLVVASAAITFSAAYTPWGDTLESHGTGNFSFGYFGGLMDAATGLLYAGNGQYYDPSTGRFLNHSANPDSTINLLVCNALLIGMYLSACAPAPVPLKTIPITRLPRPS
jgi:RHS repeat-associated protein